jgi:hypothetical protein
LHAKDSLLGGRIQRWLIRISRHGPKEIENWRLKIEKWKMAQVEDREAGGAPVCNRLCVRAGRGADYQSALRSRIVRNAGEAAWVTKGIENWRLKIEECKLAERVSTGQVRPRPVGTHDNSPTLQRWEQR